MALESRNARDSHLWADWRSQLPGKRLSCMETAYSLGSVSEESGAQDFNVDLLR